MRSTACQRNPRVITKLCSTMTLSFVWCTPCRSHRRHRNPGRHRCVPLCVVSVLLLHDAPEPYRFLLESSIGTILEPFSRDILMHKLCLGEAAFWALHNSSLCLGRAGGTGPAGNQGNTGNTGSQGPTGDTGMCLHKNLQVGHAGRCTTPMLAPLQSGHDTFAEALSDAELSIALMRRCHGQHRLAGSYRCG